MTDPTIDSITAEINAFEGHFKVRNHDGTCIDWMSASRDREGFVRYIRNRDWLRANEAKV